MPGEYFKVRRLIWEDICMSIQSSEAEELRRAIGNSLIDDSVQLKQELGVLVEILAEYQEQSDCVRESFSSRSQSRVPEPPGRALLLEKLKLLATNVASRDGGSLMMASSKEEELIKYVLSVDESGSDGVWSSSVTTPRMAEVFFMSPHQSAGDVVLLRPSTGSGTRPTTASSLGRPVSRGSTLSLSSTTSSIVECPEIRKRLNIAEIDSITEDVQAALKDERQQLLDDIEFVQSCIDMEKELLDDDRQRVVSAKPPPTFQELQDLGRVLERTLYQQEDFERVQVIVSKAGTLDHSNGFRMRHALQSGSTPSNSLSRPPTPGRSDCERFIAKECEKDESLSRSPSATSGRRVPRKVHKIRHTIQEARDEPFLT